MSLADLLQAGPPAFHLTTATSDELDDEVVALGRSHPSAAVRRIRGARCRTVDGWFAELAAALQFPSYFGENWPALADLLTDLSWLPAEQYVFVFEDAEELLADAIPDALALALATLAEAAQEYAPIPYHLVLQAPPDGRVAAALKAAGIPFS